VTYQWYDLGWVLCEVLSELVVVNNEVGDINVAVILLHEHVLSDLISAPWSILVEVTKTRGRTCR